jgi:TPR repeat protein
LAPAQFHLGALYAKGRSSAPQLVLAHMWLSLAAPPLPSTRRTNARKVLSAMQTQMTACHLDEARRLAREWRPRGKITE